MQVIFCLAPLRDGDGRLTGYAAVAHDITQRKAEERTRQLLLGELNHRVKNTLAIVQSIASQTLRRAETAWRISSRAFRDACARCRPRTMC